MVERFTITAAKQDPWMDADANGQWVRYADYAAERERWIDYTTDLQQIIEALCGNRKLPQPVSSARHHYNMAERALAERAGGVNEDALRALAQAYDREHSAQRGEPDPWNLDPGDIGDSDTWVSERLACARVAAEAFLSTLSRTGAVKVKALGDWRRGYCDDEVTIEQVSTGFGSIYQVRIFEGTIWLDYPVREKEAFPTVEAAKAAAQADYERRILSALTTEPAAPEGQQSVEIPVGWFLVPEVPTENQMNAGLYQASHDAEYADVCQSYMDMVRTPVDAPSLTRPSEQAVTEAMVEAAVQAVRQYTSDTLFIDEHRELVRAALKAAMEAGR